MKEILEKFKLVEQLTTEIEIQKSEFVSRLKSAVDEGSTGMFSDTFDLFSKSKNVYKGRVEYDGFEIKKRKRFFDMNMNVAVASGSYSQDNELLVIKTEINGFSKKMIPFYIFLIIFYSIFIGSFFFQ